MMRLWESILSIFTSKKNISKGQLGVHWTSSGLSLASVRPNAAGRPELIDCHWLPGKADTADLGLPQLVKQKQLQSYQTVTVLAADEYQLMQVEMASLPAEERRDAARWQIREMLSYAAEEAVVDLYDVPSYGSDRKPLTYVVAAREKGLRSRLALLQEADLVSSAIDIPEFALRNLADLFTADTRGVALLLLQESDGLLIIAREGQLFLTRSFSIGMNDLLPQVDAGLEALSEQLDAIVLEIQRSFDYCESTFLLPTVSHLLVAQTVQEIPAVNTYLNDYLATEVEPLCFEKVLQVPAGLEQLELNRHLLAIGGALRQENA